MTDVLGDHVDFMIGTPQQMMPLVKAGKLKAYGVTQKGKMPEFPHRRQHGRPARAAVRDLLLAGNVCPVQNAGGGDQDVERRAARGGRGPGHPQDLAGEGVSPFPKNQRSPAAAIAFKSETARWGKMIKDNNITVKQ